MTRQLRIEYAGALYHVMSRGNNKQPIFESDHDRRLFLRILSRTIKTYGWICHAYCLMGNHYHLLIETIDPNLSKGMRDLNGDYTKKFNHKYEKVGHLLQGRYKAIIIEQETYLRIIARYIVLNPVADGFVKHPADWLWSSFRPTAGLSKAPKFLTINSVLSMFAKDPLVAQKKYRNFVENNLNDCYPADEDEILGVVIGSPQFQHAMWQKSFDSEEIKNYSLTERMISRLSLKEIFKNTESKAQRNELIIFARLRCKYFIAEISRFLELDPSTISKIIKKYEKVDL